jgi:hypothetical protein
VQRLLAGAAGGEGAGAARPGDGLALSREASNKIVCVLLAVRLGTAGDLRSRASLRLEEVLGLALGDWRYRQPCLTAEPKQLAIIAESIQARTSFCKINATVDALGNPTGFALTPGNAHDLDGADLLLPAVNADIVIAAFPIVT